MKAGPAGPLRACLSPIGLGCATFGRESDRVAAFAMMDHALAHGITLFDTAADYSAGGSEQIVGSWLASRRPAPGSLVVATKMRAPYSPSRVEDAIAQSLRRLGVDTLDLFFFHEWTEEATDPGVLAVLDRAVREGKITALGASNFTAGQLERVLKQQAEMGYARIQALENNHNFAVRRVDEPLLQLCSEENVAIITFSPLAAGFLTGKYRHGVEPGSRFAIAPAHQKLYFNDEAWRRLAWLEGISTSTGHPMTLLAMAWALHRPGIASVLVGGRTPAHLDQALAALAFDQPELFRQLDAQR